MVQVNGTNIYLCIFYYNIGGVTGTGHSGTNKATGAVLRDSVQDTGRLHWGHGGSREPDILLQLCIRHGAGNLYMHRRRWSGGTLGAIKKCGCSIIGVVGAMAFGVSLSGGHRVLVSLGGTVAVGRCRAQLGALEILTRRMWLSRGGGLVHGRPE